LKALARKHTVSLLALVDSAEAGACSGLSLLEDLAHTVQVIPSQIFHAKRRQQLISIARGESYLLNLYILKEMQDALDAMLARDNYDVVLFESVLLAGYRVPDGVKVVIDQHNIEHELLQRTYQREKAWSRKWYNWLEGRPLKSGEIERCRRADVVLVTSAREHLLLKSMLPRSVIRVVPNGADIQAFQYESPEKEVPNQIIFTGTMDYYPNITAVLFFAQQCWPLIQARVPGATWQIVGRKPPPEVQRLAELPGVTVTGFVPDVRPYLARAAVAIAPLQIGSGTRLKILEAFAMQKAVVSTGVGCEGLSVKSGKHLIVADQPEAFAQAVVELLSNPSMRIALGSAGRALVEAEYSWEQCGAQLLHVLEETC
jgi:sugar transferase (PEP-CTERM/EpsH1 system associated)